MGAGAGARARHRRVHLRVDLGLHLHLPQLLLRRRLPVLSRRRGLLRRADPARDRRGGTGDDGRAGHGAQQPGARRARGRTCASCRAPLRPRPRASAATRRGDVRGGDAVVGEHGPAAGAHRLGEAAAHRFSQTTTSVVVSLPRRPAIARRSSWLSSSSTSPSTRSNADAPASISTSLIVPSAAFRTTTASSTRTVFVSTSPASGAVTSGPSPDPGNVMATHSTGPAGGDVTGMECSSGDHRRGRRGRGTPEHSAGPGRAASSGREEISPAAGEAGTGALGQPGPPPSRGRDVMCRWLGYLGSPIEPRELLYDPERSLIEQSRRHAPDMAVAQRRRVRPGLVRAPGRARPVPQRDPGLG